MNRARVLTAAALMVLVGAVMLIVGIWTGDDRWVQTAMVIGMPGVFVAILGWVVEL